MAVPVEALRGLQALAEALPEPPQVLQDQAHALTRLSAEALVQEAATQEVLPEVLQAVAVASPEVLQAEAPDLHHADLTAAVAVAQEAHQEHPEVALVVPEAQEEAQEVRVVAQEAAEVTKQGQDSKLRNR